MWLLLFNQQTLTYAVSRADVSPEGDTSNIDGSHSGELRTQNQVALVAVCELLGAYSDELPPPVIIATTHLKVNTNCYTKAHRLFVGTFQNNHYLLQRDCSYTLYSCIIIKCSFIMLTTFGVFMHCMRMVSSGAEELQRRVVPQEPGRAAAVRSRALQGHHRELARST